MASTARSATVRRPLCDGRSVLRPPCDKTFRSRGYIAAVRHLITAAAAARLVSAAPPSAASAVQADPSTWLVGARPSATSTALARAAGATRVVADGWEVPRAKATGLAAELRARHLLTYAEPNRYSRLHQSQRAIPQDPLDA